LNRYLLIISNSVLAEYNKHYFELYPRRRVAPVLKPVHPSLNEWTHMNNIEMNILKQKFNDFMVWLVNISGYSNLKINKCKITINTYYPTKHRHDNDNQSPKFFLDALVHAGMLIDDDYNHLNPLIIYGAYDKANPRTEILIEELD
jgi:Holliday junction resolvase RusA-like endonuclease